MLLNNAQQRLIIVNSEPIVEMMRGSLLGTAFPASVATQLDHGSPAFPKASDGLLCPPEVPELSRVPACKCTEGLP